MHSILEVSLEDEEDEELERCPAGTQTVLPIPKDQPSSSSQGVSQVACDDGKKDARVTFPEISEEKIEEIDLKDEDPAQNEGVPVRREKSYYEKPRLLKLFKDDADSDEPEILYDVEFVYTEEAPAVNVKLAGTFNGWMPLQMYKESSGKWSVITKMEKGTHEFRFVVDGEWLLSHIHPQTENEDPSKVNNIRVVTGPNPGPIQERTMIPVTKHSMTCCVIQ